MNLRTKLVSVTNKFNAVVLKQYGHSLPIVIINEFPKSGGTWYAKMLASALDIPFIDGGIFVPNFPCVIRTHWRPSAKYHPCVYVVRDCRDVMVSLFHHRCKNIKNIPKLNKLYCSEFGEPLSVGKIKQQLAGFIQIEFETRRYGTQYSWAEHILLAQEICKKNENSILIKYEDIVTNPQKSLSLTFEQLFKLEVNADKLDLVCELYDKKWASGQQLKTKTVTTFFRKGVVGDWKSVYCKEAAGKLAQYVNNELLQMGYIDSLDWWKEIDNLNHQ